MGVILLQLFWIPAPFRDIGYHFRIFIVFWWIKLYTAYVMQYQNLIGYLFYLDWKNQSLFDPWQVIGCTKENTQSCLFLLNSKRKLKLVLFLKRIRITWTVLLPVPYACSSNISGCGLVDRQEFITYDLKAIK